MSVSFLGPIVARLAKVAFKSFVLLLMSQKEGV
jgi:hypothetical protein